MPPAFIALGSNLGDRAAHLNAAIEGLARLPASRFVRASLFIETDPVGPAGQGLYLNSVAHIETALPPRQLLQALLDIERRQGRERRERWGPRTLDLDLLVYGNLILDEPGLTLPHPRLHERRFVLEPLATIAPELIIPGLGRAVRDLLASLP